MDGERAGPSAGVPEHIGGYRILRKLGHGGMGDIYLAEQIQLRRRVALKILPPEFARDYEALARFKREAETVARLSHPHICPIIEIGEEAGVHFYAMEYLAGRDLSEVLATQRMDWERAAKIAHQAAQALGYAHRHGVVHRDVSPRNLILTRTDQRRRVGAWRSTTRRGRKVREEPAVVLEAGGPGVVDPERERAPSPEYEDHVWLIDFGLARDAQRTMMTMSGDIFGTAAYMAPEVARAGATKAVPATDVYSLGAVLYEMLTGHPPFRGASALDVLERVKNEEPAPVRSLRRDVPRDLEVIVMKCLMKDPARRYPNGDALAEDLRRFFEGEPIAARPPSVVYRAGKWVRRHRLLAGSAGAAAAGVMLFAAVALWLVPSLRYRKALAQDEEKIRRWEAHRTAQEKGAERMWAAARAAAEQGQYDEGIRKVNEMDERWGLQWGVTPDIPLNHPAHWERDPRLRPADTMLPQAWETAAQAQRAWARDDPSRAGRAVECQARAFAYAAHPLAGNPAEARRLLRGLCEVLEEQQRWEDAAAAWQDFLTFQPPAQERREARRRIARALARAGRFEQALRWDDPEDTDPAVEFARRVVPATQLNRIVEDAAPGRGGIAALHEDGNVAWYDLEWRQVATSLPKDAVPKSRKLPSGTVACIDTDGDGTDEVAVLRGEIALFARREEYLEKIAMLPCDLDVRTSALTAADVDGDGHSEVVCILGHYARRLWVLRTPGLAPIPFDPEIHQDIEQCLALDIDGDGDDELLLCGGKYGSTPELTNSLALADLTDGRLVIRGSYDEKCRLWSVPAPVPCGTECEAGICVAVYASAAQPELPFRNVRYAPCGLHVIHIARDGTFRFRSHQPLPPDTTDAICFRTPLGGPNTAWQGVQTRDDLLIFAPDAPDHPVCIPSFIGSVLRPVRDFSGRIAGFLQVQVAPKAAPRLLGIGRHPIERAQDPAPRWLWNWYDVARELERIRAFEGAADAYRAAGDGVGVARCLIRGNADRPERAEWASAQMLETLDNSETETARALTLVAPVAGIARKPEQQRRAAEVLRRLADRPDLDEGWKSMLRRKADLLDARANATVVWSLPDAEAMPPLEAGTPWSLRRCDDGTWRWSRVWGDSSFFRLRFRAQDLKMAAIRLEGRIERLDWGAALPLAVAAGGSRSADWSDRPLSPIATSIGPGPTTYLHQPQVWLSNRSVPIPFACGRDIEVELTYESTLWPEPAYCEVILRPSGSDPHRAAEPLPTPIASGTLLVGDPQGHVLPQLPAPYRGIVAIRRLEVVAPPNSLTPDTDWQPRTPIEHYWVANGFYGLGQWQKAEEHYTLCLESVSDPNPSPPKDGTNPAVWVWRARLFRAFARMRLGREEDAREDFRSAFERSPVWTLATIGPHVPVLDDAERRFAGTMLRPFLENRDALAAWAQKYVEQSAGNPYWTIGTRFGFGLLEIALPERMDGKLFRLLHEDVGRYFAGGYAEGAVEALREAARISPERTESVLEWVLNRSNPQQWSGSHERLAGDLWYALARDYDQRGDREAAQRCRDRVEGSY